MYSRLMAKDTIYLCNFRVSVDGEWLCLKELADVQFETQKALSVPQYAFDGLCGICCVYMERLR